MSSGSTPWGQPATPGRRRSWLAAGGTAAVRLLALYLLLLAGVALLLALLTPLAISAVLITRGLLRQGQAAVATVLAKPGPHGGTTIHPVVLPVATTPHLPMRLAASESPECRRRVMPRYETTTLHGTTSPCTRARAAVPESKAA